MISKIQNHIKTSELRKNLAKYLSDSSKSPVVVSGGHSDGERVLMDSSLYNTLVEIYEDYHDSVTLSELASKNDERISWEEVKKNNRI